VIPPPEVRQASALDFLLPTFRLLCKGTTFIVPPAALSIDRRQVRLKFLCLGRLPSREQRPFGANLLPRRLPSGLKQHPSLVHSFFALFPELSLSSPNPLLQMRYAFSLLVHLNNPLLAYNLILSDPPPSLESNPFRFKLISTGSFSHLDLSVRRRANSPLRSLFPPPLLLVIGVVFFLSVQDSEPAPTPCTRLH